MNKLKYTDWQEGDMWLGCLEEYPDYMTQGESQKELELNLKDIYQDLSSGEIPSPRRIGELRFA